MRPEQIDLVALAGARAASREWLNRVLHDEDYAREYYGVAWPSRRRVLEKKMRKWGARFGLIDASRGKFGISQRERLGAVTDHLGVARRPHREPRSPHLSRGGRLLGLGLRGPDRAGAHQRQLGRRPLRHRLHRRGPRARASRGEPERARLGGRVLLVRHPRPRHEVRRARVQGHGHGALRSGQVRPARGGGPARGVRPRGGPPRALPLAGPGRALPAPAARDGRPALRLGGGRRAAAAGGRAAAVDAPHAAALRRRAARPRRRRVHEREGQHARRPGGVGRGAVRVPVVRRRVQRGRRRVPRVSAGVRAARGDRGAPGLRSGVPRPLGHRRGGGGGHPRARARGAVQGRLPRPHRGAHRGAAGLGRGGGPLRRPHGVRRARARQPVDPGQPVGSPGRRR